MMEAISRDAVLNEFCHSCDGWSCNPNTCCKTEWIRKLPPIQPDNGLQSLAEEIATFKRCVKSENSDYLTGYLCALSAVEGMIADMREVNRMSLREEQCQKVCRILDNVLANRPTERDSLIVAVRKAFKALEEPHWIPVTERLPENNDPVNVTWVNHNPEVYYMDIKDKPFTATAHYHRGHWYWYSSVTQDYLDEYGEWTPDLVNKDVEIIAWMPLPEPYKGVTT